jgi:hypothetical protein
VNFTVFYCASVYNMFDTKFFNNKKCKYEVTSFVPVKERVCLFKSEMEVQ